MGIKGNFFLKRTASCVAVDQCILISLRSDYFKHYLGELFRSLNSLRLTVLQEMNIFQIWSRPQLSGLVRHLSSRYPVHGQYLYQAGRQDRYVYIILEGEFEITAKIPQRKNIETYKNYLKSSGGTKEVVVLRLKKGGHFGTEDGYKTLVKKFSVRASSNNCKLFILPKDVKKFLYRKLLRMLKLIKFYWEKCMKFL